MKKIDSPSARTARSNKFNKERAKIRQVVEQRGLSGIANDTKWDELIVWCRSHLNFVPQYRFKCVDSNFISEWDSEWYWHLPYPLSSVEWMELTFFQEKHQGNLIAPSVSDYSLEIENTLQRIGLEYMKGKSIIRIFGYLPFNLEGFE